MNSASENLELTLAINDSDQVRDLTSGRIQTNGINLRTLHYEVEEIFFRFTKFREWDLSEMSLAKFCSLRSAGDDSLIGIPVFPSRSFRHSGIFVRADGPVDDPVALAGARIGFPEWTVTATVYQRALLQHEYGVDLTSVDWVQGGINEPGRIETLPLGLPAGIQVRQETDRSLNDLLVDGDLDAIIVPHPPAGYTDGSGRLVQIFSDVVSVEEDYYRRNRIFPIMHLLALRSDVYDQHPWVVPNLVTAFTEAKDRSLARMLDLTAPHTPLPWGPDRARAVSNLFGADFWPYGVDANRTTLEAFLQYGREQRLVTPEFGIDDLFPAAAQETYLI